MCLELWSLAFEAELLLNSVLSANFKLERMSAASRDFLVNIILENYTKLINELNLSHHQSLQKNDI